MPTSPQGVQRIYGLHAVRMMLERHAARVRRVYLTERRADGRVRGIEELAQRHARDVQRVEPRALQQLLGDVAHQGVAAEIEPLAPWSEDALLTALQAAVAPLLLALDGVQDPHNLGACLRTADACGALALIVPRSLLPPRARWRPGLLRAPRSSRSPTSCARSDSSRRRVCGWSARMRPRSSAPTPWTSRDRWCWCWVGRAADCGN